MSNTENFSISITGQITKDERLWCNNIFRDVLNHAWLKKTDVSYNEADKILVIKLRRHDQGSKAKRKFLCFVIWNNSIPPNKQCLLTIRDVEYCGIHDEDPKSQEVIIGGMAFDKEDEIYIGAFCEYEEPYGITLKVKRINLTLEDIR